MNPKTYGQIAYEGYCSATGGKSLVSGDNLPEFHALKDEIRNAWEAAADAVHACIAELLPHSQGPQ